MKISKKSGHGHIPSCFSIVEIVFAIYETMKHDPKNPAWGQRDIFILSKGHAALAYYCVLAQFEYFDIKKVETFGGFNSSFGCHADRFKIPGVEVSTGSLGHGIGVATGIALAFKILKNKRMVYTVIGDGEANEGTVWESIMLGVSLKLDNLTVIYDNNMSHSEGLQIYDPVAHFRGFGCDVREVSGHDIEAIKREIESRADTGSLKVIVANTKKGYGCKTFIENSSEWHRKSPNDDEFALLMKEICSEEAV